MDDIISLFVSSSESTTKYVEGVSVLQGLCGT